MAAEVIGYARVSTEDQNLDLQRDALTRAGCARIYEDHMSGAKAARPGLKLALEVVRSGDQLVVWRLDRLGRSISNLIELVRVLQARGVELRRSLKASIRQRSTASLPSTCLPPWPSSNGH